jgi:hypothetical protein
MIDRAINATGKASIQLDMSDGALEEWIDWMYGTPMTDHCDIDYLEHRLELYEYCYDHFHPEIDHECANACLDGIRAMLTNGVEDWGADEMFESGRIPPLPELAIRLGKHSEKGVEMLVDLLVHIDYWDPISVVDLVKDMKSEPRLALLFHKLTCAFAIKSFNVTQEDGPEHAISAPDPMSPHAYHSFPASENACCGRRLHAPVVFEEILSTPVDA